MRRSIPTALVTRPPVDFTADSVLHEQFFRINSNRSVRTDADSRPQRSRFRIDHNYANAAEHRTGGPREPAVCSPVSVAEAPAASTSAGEVTVIGPPVPIMAANVTGRRGGPTGTTARRTGCSRKPRPTPKSVYGYIQASANPERGRLPGIGDPHDLHALYLVASKVAHVSRWRERTTRTTRDTRGTREGHAPTVNDGQQRSRLVTYASRITAGHRLFLSKCAGQHCA